MCVWGDRENCYVDGNEERVEERVEGVHLIKVVVEWTRQAIDYHNVELESKGDRDSVEFKCRSG